MNKNLFLRLCLMMAVLFTLWQCRNEDLSLAENNPKRNNSEFFKHSSSGGLANRGGVDYVRILEVYNEEHNFLATMPDQSGMPVWEKMQVLNVGEKKALYIPLSADETSLSSLMLVSVDQNSEITVLRNFTNDYLKNFVYNSDYRVEKRKFLMDTFMEMDFLTFGHQRFTNLPIDLYEGSTKHNRLDILDVKTETFNDGKIIIQQHCTKHHFCANGCSYGNCDFASCPGHEVASGIRLYCKVSTTCSTTYGWQDDPFFFPTSPGSEGGGGGPAGCHTCPGNTPPKDDCMQINTFYRMAVNCGNNGIGDDGDLFDDPCEEAALPTAVVNNLLHDNNISPQISALENHALTATAEYGMAITDNGGVTVAQNPYTDGNSGTVSITFPTTGNPLVAAHSHHKDVVPPPSAKDFYNAMQLIKDHPTYLGSMVFCFNGTKYAFVVKDRAKVIAFLNAHPKQQNLTADEKLFNKNFDIGIDFNNIVNNYRTGSLPSYSGASYNDGLESAMAEILQKFDAGVSLAKTDANGNLKPLQSVSFEYTIPMSGGKKITAYKAEPCP